MGYRQSNFDPLATTHDVHPMVRPFDRWQWFGVFALLFGLGLMLLWGAGRAGLLPQGFEVDSMVFTMPFLVGGPLLLRRDPDVAPGVLGERLWPLMASVLGLLAVPLAFVA